MSFESIVLAPSDEEKEVYPYRRVWRTASIEIIILLVITLILNLIEHFKHFTLSPTQTSLVSLGFAVLPLLLWLGISYTAERRAALPRRNLFTVLVLSMLVASAVGEPLINRAFAVNDWLSTTSGIMRILGFTLITGFTQEFLKYAVMRYTIWPTAFRIRSDGIAYSIAVAVGYATALNIAFILNMNGNLDPAALALRVSEVTLSQVAIGTIMGYLLAELKLSQPPSIFLLPLGLCLAAALTGIYTAARGGLIVGAISDKATANNGFEGLGAAVFLVTFLFVSFNFLITNADERARLRSRTEFAR